MRTFPKMACVLLVLIAIGLMVAPMANAQKQSNVAVTSTVADADFQIQSDDGGVYTNSKAVQSIIQPIGDWVLDTNYSLLSTRSVWLNFSQPVAGTGPNGGAPVPPFPYDPHTGLYAALVKARLITQCPTYGYSMLGLTNGETVSCGLVIHIPYNGNDYRLVMNPLGINNYSETETVNVTCNGVGTNGCRQWSIVSADPDLGSKARLVQLTTGKKPAQINLGNFYFSFSITINVTKP